ncbi:hypothetical protein ED28_16360 [[Pantoea] beijingensis]|uniref:Laccase domain-containing protein n=1 Tax=[Pantoea] beijingensis TaxID=1324864 RepID=A0A443I9Y3_9GAMM|nr:polyphenol oxidase family protein [[Pantoea] beijingensis]RWR01021.1 hypothetical protein ED28_16360 [[Pantoea] beijingensis]
MQNTWPEHTLFSPLLTSLGWVEHAFYPAGHNPPAASAYAHQRHSPDIILDHEAIPPKQRDADGVIALSDRPVAIYTADCLPVLIADERQHHVAAVHAGLKGALAGVLLTAVSRLIEQGAIPNSLYIAIGPAIGPCCYELGSEVLGEIQRNPLLHHTPLWQRKQPVNPDAIRPQAQATRDSVWFDLPALAQQMLQQLGVPATQIDRVPVCTYCTAEANSSYRRNTHFSQGYRQRFSWIRRRD